jgi:uncharacterized protein YndB with AHSA1/START domain
MSPTGEIRVERVFDAAPEEVFEAWGDAESLATWMCPGSDMESDYAQHGEYLEIDAPKRIVLTWVSEWIPTGEAATRVSVTLEPELGGKTRLVLVHDGLPEGDAYVGHPDGWNTILAKLGAALASQKETA